MTDTPTERGAESTWTRLRRRKVVQWGVAYVAGAWGLLQGLEYFIRTFDWPEQLQQLATLALLIGLPIVLVLAWYHGDRGEQRVSTPELAILTSCCCSAAERSGTSRARSRPLPMLHHRHRTLPPQLPTPPSPCFPS